MRAKTFTNIVIILLLLSLYANYKQFVLNSHYKGMIPYLLKGERIPNVDLIDKNSQFIAPERLKKGTAVIFAFMKGCSPCDKNIVFWKRIAKLFKNKISAIGVVLSSPTEAFKFEEDANLNFKIYVPDDLQEYTKDMRMLMNRSQTIVLQDGRVKMVKAGNLDTKNLLEIIKLLKDILK